jgi:GNAT superfamily N-acetyltransferase
MAGLQIRDACAADHAMIQAVTLAAYQQYVAVAQELWDWYQQDIVKTLADFKPAELIVAEHDGVIAGSVLLYPAGTVLAALEENPPPLRWPEVRLLAVTPASRGQGVGAALVNECIRRARQSGADALTLHTLDFMRSAKQMYEGLGFVRCPELDALPAPQYHVKGYRYTFAD